MDITKKDDLEWDKFEICWAYLGAEVFAFCIRQNIESTIIVKSPVIVLQNLFMHIIIQTFRVNINSQILILIFPVHSL